MGVTGRKRPLVVALLIDDMWSHDLANVIQVFADSPTLGEEAPCELVFVAPGGRARLDHGLSAEALTLERTPARADLVCVPGFASPAATFGATGSDATPGPDAARAADPAAVTPADPKASATAGARDELDACCSWLRRAYESGAQVAALGTGTFVLARAGLLDGVTCTTHHAYVELFSALFPTARLEPERILTRDAARRVWTSAGGVSGLDLCLSLLATLAGPRAAADVSSAMSLWRPRSLETRQEAFGMPGTTSEARAMSDVDALRAAVSRDLSHPWTVSEMARVAGMSERSLQRHFLRNVGETPKTWLTSQRLELASALLEQTDLPLPVVAARVGLGSADVLYRLFRDHYGEAPSAHRRRFAQG